MSYKLVVFDIAGTTLADDHAVAASFRKAFAQSGLAIAEEDARPLMGYKKTEAIRIMLEQLGEAADPELIEEIHADFVKEMKEHYLGADSVVPTAGAEDMFSLLKEKGIRIAVNTGFPREIADAILQRTKWIERGLVDDSIASDEVPAGRPDPAMIRELMRRANVADASEVVKIGDTEVDVNEGREAGCALVIAVTTGAFTREELLPYKPDYIVDHLSELPSILFDRA
ncbi:MAG: HAD family hydrolase [Chitinophagaceae bacterium]